MHFEQKESNQTKALQTTYDRLRKETVQCLMRQQEQSEFHLNPGFFDSLKSKKSEDLKKTLSEYSLEVFNNFDRAISTLFV